MLKHSSIKSAAMMAHTDIWKVTTAQVAQWPCIYQGFMDFLTHTSHHPNSTVIFIPTSHVLVMNCRSEFVPAKPCCSHSSQIFYVLALFARIVNYIINAPDICTRRKYCRNKIPISSANMERVRKIQPIIYYQLLAEKCFVSYKMADGRIFVTFPAITV